MSHTLTFASGSIIPIYVDPEGYTKEAHPIVVQHQVLDATRSVLQYMGAKSNTLAMRWRMYGQGAFDYTFNKIKDGYTFKYTDDRGTSGSFVCAEAQVACRRIQALNYPDTWWLVETNVTEILGSGSLYYQWAAP